MAVNRRLLGASIVVAAALSLAGGFALSRGSADDGLDVTLDEPTIAQVPSIVPNDDVSGSKLPDVVLERNDGGAVHTSELLGQPLIINYWYSTCAPCARELTAFAAVQRDLGDTIRFVGVNAFDTPEVNESFARDRGVGYELLRDPDGAYTDALGITNAPVTLFVAADGTIVRQTGVLDEDALRQAAEDLLG